ncbi:MAG: hypothetical protein PVF15_05100 [Candidatus Bathyarchaeota archaeon]|jgi:hypothetical protein
MLKLKNELISESPQQKDDQVKILLKLKRLEEEILRVKGKKRERAKEIYRKLLWMFQEEPVYLVRYE